MNKTIILFALLLSYGCEKENKQQSLAIIKTDKEINKNQITETDPYKISLHIDKLSKDIYNVSINMKLYDNAFFVSPNAKREFSGKFKFVIDANDKFNQEGELIEAPQSIEEFDPHPFVNGNVNWVRENTTYKQQLQISTEKDFEVMGFIQFTIEPRCTLEKIPVIIKYTNGEMKFEIFQC